MPDDVATAIAGAWAYEELHVKALFQQWTVHILEAGQVGAGDNVLDVACGTGVLARAALDRVATGSVTGLDIGPGMLTVAEQVEPRVTWVEGDATRLPFDDDHFDAVVSQFGLMFFPDRAQAISEMLRCTKPGRRIVVAVWDSLERSQAYAVAVDLLQRRAGQPAADALSAPFVLGDTATLRQIFEDAGSSAPSIETRHGTARFPSVRSMVEADLRGWLPVMGVFLDDHLIEEILVEAEHDLREFVQPDGTMTFDAPSHVVTAHA